MSRLTSNPTLTNKKADYTYHLYPDSRADEVSAATTAAGELLALVRPQTAPTMWQALADERPRSRHPARPFAAAHRNPIWLCGGAW
jgi:hypothetical protein